jgi:RNA polymerase sigma factor (sigma-70 family)
MTPEQLYAKYHRLAWCIARSMQATCSLTNEDAEDIFSASWLKLLQQPPKNWEKPLYVRVVLRCGARNELERINRHRRMLSYEDLALHPLLPEQYDDGFEPLAFDTPDTTRLNPEEELIQKDLLDKYISILSAPERAIVDLMLGLTGEDPMSLLNIAKRLAMPLAQVKNTLEASYERMRRLMKESPCRSESQPEEPSSPATNCVATPSGNTTLNDPVTNSSQEPTAPASLLVLSSANAATSSCRLS